MMVVSVLAVLAGMAVPRLLNAQDVLQMEAAARYLVAEAMLTRSRAARHGTAVGLRFELDRRGDRSGGEYHWTAYVDGDGDGILAADVVRGIDSCGSTLGQLDG